MADFDGRLCGCLRVFHDRITVKINISLIIHNILWAIFTSSPSSISFTLASPKLFPAQRGVRDASAALLPVLRVPMASS